MKMVEDLFLCVVWIDV